MAETAKKGKKTVKKAEPTVEITENTIMENVETIVAENISEITEKFEKLQVQDELINEISEMPVEEAQEVLSKELEKIDNLKVEVEEKIKEVINEMPKPKKKMNFTYSWNGLNLYE